MTPKTIREYLDSVAAHDGDLFGDRIALAPDDGLDDKLELRRIDEVNALERDPSVNGDDPEVVAEQRGRFKQQDDELDRDIVRILRGKGYVVHKPDADDGDGKQLVIMGAREIATQLESEPPPRWLARPVWPADAYGIIAAEDKAGKTWSFLDLLVSIAYDVPWMGLYPCEQSGPVLGFLGEGGRRKMLRRLRAICEAKGVEYDDRIRLCFRAPHLTDKEHLAEVRAELQEHRPVFTGIDPLYLAARGARGSDLYEMGAHLEDVQHACQDANSALAVVTHYKKTGDDTGFKRITGVGPGAWGRVLATADVAHRRTEPDRSTIVVLAWQFRGDEIPDTDIRIRRRVWADNPDDLASPLHYTIETVDDDTPGATDDGLSPSTQRVLAALRGADGSTSVKRIGDTCADQGHPLKARTIQTALKTLTDLGLADGGADSPGIAGLWWATDEP
jgi:AAA domain